MYGNDFSNSYRLFAYEFDVIERRSNRSSDRTTFIVRHRHAGQTIRKQVFNYHGTDVSFNKGKTQPVVHLGFLSGGGANF